jgi:hypothetical protein
MKQRGQQENSLLVYALASPSFMLCIRVVGYTIYWLGCLSTFACYLGFFVLHLKSFSPLNESKFASKYTPK